MAPGNPPPQQQQQQQDQQTAVPPLSRRRRTQSFLKAIKHPESTGISLPGEMPLVQVLCGLLLVVAGVEGAVDLTGMSLHRVSDGTGISSDATLCGKLLAVGEGPKDRVTFYMHDSVNAFPRCGVFVSESPGWNQRYGQQVQCIEAAGQTAWIAVLGASITEVLKVVWEGSPATCSAVSVTNMTLDADVGSIVISKLSRKGDVWTMDTAVAFLENVTANGVDVVFDPKRDMIVVVDPVKESFSRYSLLNTAFYSAGRINTCDDLAAVSSTGPVSCGGQSSDNGSYANETFEPCSFDSRPADFDPCQFVSFSWWTANKEYTCKPRTVGAERGGCHPASSVVVSPTGPVSVKDIRSGDLILTCAADDTAKLSQVTGRQSGCYFTKVYGFHHAEETDSLEYVEVQYSSDCTAEGKLRLSKDHLFVANGVFIEAQFAKVGDVVITSCDANGTYRRAVSTISGIEIKTDVGQYAFGTDSGDALVDGILSSNYAGDLPQWRFQLIFLPLRALMSTTGSYLTSDAEKFHWYVIGLCSLGGRTDLSGGDNDMASIRSLVTPDVTAAAIIGGLYLLRSQEGSLSKGSRMGPVLGLLICSLLWQVAAGADVGQTAEVHETSRVLGTETDHVVQFTAQSTVHMPCKGQQSHTTGCTESVSGHRVGNMRFSRVGTAGGEFCYSVELLMFAEHQDRVTPFLTVHPDIEEWNKVPLTVCRSMGWGVDAPVGSPALRFYVPTDAKLSERTREKIRFLQPFDLLITHGEGGVCETWVPAESERRHRHDNVHNATLDHAITAEFADGLLKQVTVATNVRQNAGYVSAETTADATVLHETPRLKRGARVLNVAEQQEVFLHSEATSKKPATATNKWFEEFEGICADAEVSLPGAAKRGKEHPVEAAEVLRSMLMAPYETSERVRFLFIAGFMAEEATAELLGWCAENAFCSRGLQMEDTGRILSSAALSWENRWGTTQPRYSKAAMALLTTRRADDYSVGDLTYTALQHAETARHHDDAATKYLSHKEWDHTWRAIAAHNMKMTPATRAALHVLVDDTCSSTADLHSCTPYLKALKKDPRNEGTRDKLIEVASMHPHTTARLRAVELLMDRVDVSCGHMQYLMDTEKSERIRAAISTIKPTGGRCFRVLGFDKKFGFPVKERKKQFGGDFAKVMLVSTLGAELKFKGSAEWTDLSFDFRAEAVAKAGVVVSALSGFIEKTVLEGGVHFKAKVAAGFDFSDIAAAALGDTESQSHERLPTKRRSAKSLQDIDISIPPSLQWKTGEAKPSEETIKQMAKACDELAAGDNVLQIIVGPLAYKEAIKTVDPTNSCGKKILYASGHSDHFHVELADSEIPPPPAEEEEEEEDDEEKTFMDWIIKLAELGYGRGTEAFPYRPLQIFEAVNNPDEPNPAKQSGHYAPKSLIEEMLFDDDAVEWQRVDNPFCAEDHVAIVLKAPNDGRRKQLLSAIPGFECDVAENQIFIAFAGITVKERQLANISCPSFFVGNSTKNESTSRHAVALSDSLFQREWELFHVENCIPVMFFCLRVYASGAVAVGVGWNWDIDIAARALSVGLVPFVRADLSIGGSVDLFLAKASLELTATIADITLPLTMVLKAPSFPIAVSVGWFGLELQSGTGHALVTYPKMLCFEMNYTDTSFLTEYTLDVVDSDNGSLIYHNEGVSYVNPCMRNLVVEANRVYNMTVAVADAVYHETTVVTSFIADLTPVVLKTMTVTCEGEPGLQWADDRLCVSAVVFSRPLTSVRYEWSAYTSGGMSFSGVMRENSTHVSVEQSLNETMTRGDEYTVVLYAIYGNRNVKFQAPMARIAVDPVVVVTANPCQHYNQDICFEVEKSSEISVVHGKIGDRAEVELGPSGCLPHSQTVPGEVAVLAWGCNTFGKCSPTSQLSVAMRDGIPQCSVARDTGFIITPNAVCFDFNVSSDSGCGLRRVTAFLELIGSRADVTDPDTSPAVSRSEENVGQRATMHCFSTPLQDLSVYRVGLVAVDANGEQTDCSVSAITDLSPPTPAILVKNQFQVPTGTLEFTMVPPPKVAGDPDTEASIALEVRLFSVSGWSSNDTFNWVKRIDVAYDSAPVPYVIGTDDRTGRFVITAVAQDRAGNALRVVKQIVVDSTPPTIGTVKIGSAAAHRSKLPTNTPLVVDFGLGECGQSLNVVEELSEAASSASLCPSSLRALKKRVTPRRLVTVIRADESECGAAGDDESGMTCNVTLVDMGSGTVLEVLQSTNNEKSVTSGSTYDSETVVTAAVECIFEVDCGCGDDCEYVTKNTLGELRCLLTWTGFDDVSVNVSVSLSGTVLASGMRAEGTLEFALQQDGNKFLVGLSDDNAAPAAGRKVENLVPYDVDTPLVFALEASNLAGVKTTAEVGKYPSGCHPEPEVALLGGGSRSGAVGNMSVLASNPTHGVCFEALYAHGRVCKVTVLFKDPKTGETLFTTEPDVAGEDKIEICGLEAVLPTDQPFSVQVVSARCSGCSATKQATLFLDSSAPEVVFAAGTVNTKEASFCVNSSVATDITLASMSVTATDVKSSLVADEQITTLFDAPVCVTLSEGVYNVCVSAVDAGGRTTKKCRSVQSDSNAPRVAAQVSLGCARKSGLVVPVNGVQQVWWEPTDWVCITEADFESFVQYDVSSQLIEADSGTIVATTKPGIADIQMELEPGTAVAEECVVVAWLALDIPVNIDAAFDDAVHKRSSQAFFSASPELCLSAADVVGVAGYDEVLPMEFFIRTQCWDRYKRAGGPSEGNVVLDRKVPTVAIRPMEAVSSVDGGVDVKYGAQDDYLSKVTVVIWQLDETSTVRMKVMGQASAENPVNSEDLSIFVSVDLPEERYLAVLTVADAAGNEIEVETAFWSVNPSTTTSVDVQKGVLAQFGVTVSWNVASQVPLKSCRVQLSSTIGLANTNSSIVLPAQELANVGNVTRISRGPNGGYFFNGTAIGLRASGCVDRESKVTYTFFRGLGLSNCSPMIRLASQIQQLSKSS
eukprot:gene23099-35395_t